MTDKEKAIYLTSKSFELEKNKVEWFLSTYSNSRMSEIHTFYNGVLKGLSEDRKELEIKEGIIKYWKKLCKDKSNDVTELQKEIEKMKCCGNCYHLYDELPCLECYEKSRWEIKE